MGYILHKRPMYYIPIALSIFIFVLRYQVAQAGLDLLIILPQPQG